MWLFTPIGFFSIVQKRGDNSLTVRARVASDLDLLRDQFLPSLSTITATPDGDYAFRANASHRDFGEALASMAASIDYDNFKDEVARKQGDERATRYSEVWSVMRRLQENNLSTDTPLPELVSRATITNADVVAWKKHAKSLRVSRLAFAAAASTSPCKCDHCSHCQELAKVSVEIEAVSIHASARLAWLDGRVKEPDIVVRVRIPSSPQTKSKRTSS